MNSPTHLSPETLTQKISANLIQRPVSRFWLWSVLFTLALSAYFVGALVYLIARGVGIWGINIPVAWGIAIINYVWWIEIAMGGTFISSALYVAHQPWRTTINRFAEGMMLCAWVIAALYPMIHMGRPWFWYWLIPYPNTMGLYPQFHSALFWDVVAVLTYGLVSILFFYTGLLPDLAMLRDSSDSELKKKIFGILSLGWIGSSLQWALHQQAYRIMSALALTLVFTVHSVVGLDFAITLLPGWNDPFFPPYFIAGAIFSGLSTAIILGVPLRAGFKLHQLITDRHFENMAKLQIVTGNICNYTYIMEIFLGYYSDHRNEVDQVNYRLFGEYSVIYWLSIGIISGLLQLLWIKKVRTQPIYLFFLSILFQFGMWIERFYVVVNSTSHSYIPSMDHSYAGTFWDYSMFAGSLGLFTLLFIIFSKIVPVVAISEAQELLDKRTSHEPS